MTAKRTFFTCLASRLPYHACLLGGMIALFTGCLPAPETGLKIDIPVAKKRIRKKESVPSVKPAAKVSLSAQKLYVKGQRAYYQGEYEEALKHFRSSAEADFKFMEPRVAWGKIYQETGRYDKAAEIFTRILGKDSGYFAAYVGLGRALLSKKEYDKSLETFKNALTLVPHHPEVERLLEIAQQKAIARRLLLGKKQQLLGDFSGATAEFQEILKLNSRQAAAHLQLAYILINHKKYLIAQDHLEKVLLEEPFNTGALESLAKVLYKTGRPEKARKVFQRLLDIDPSNQAARIRMEAVKKALYSDPEVPSAYYELSSSARITRGELAAILALGLKTPVSLERREETESPQDIKKHWAKKYILGAVGTGLMETLAHNVFAPDNLLTRGGLARIIHLILMKLDPTAAGNEVKGIYNPYDDLRPDNSLYPTIIYLYKTRIMKGEEKRRFGIASEVPGIEALEVVDRLDEHLAKLGKKTVSQVKPPEAAVE